MYKSTNPQPGRLPIRLRLARNNRRIKRRIIPEQKYLLQPDPAVLFKPVLVDHPTELPSAQYEALLVDSECEV